MYIPLKDFYPIDSLLTQLKCSALGLNCNFPRAVLHGPLELGGTGIPSSQQKLTAERINYFLYSIHRDTMTRKKLEISIIYTLIESGLMSQFFSKSYQRYGHLVSSVFCIQIWKETEPHGISLRPSPTKTWIPHPIFPHD